MNVLFLHGRDSKPGGTKPTELTNDGHTVWNPALPKESFEESVRIAQEIIDTEEIDYVVGSSRGAAIAMTIGASDLPLILIAPAWKAFQVEPKLPDRTIILHSKADDIVPFKDSEELSSLTGALVLECGSGHQMNDNAAIGVLKALVRYDMTSERPIDP